MRGTVAGPATIWQRTWQPRRLSEGAPAWASGPAAILLLEFESVVGPRPDEWLGFTVAPAHTGHARRAAAGLPLAPGLLIEHIHPGGPAEPAGLRRGDLLVGSGERDIRSLSCLAEVILADTGDITLRVRRGDQTTEVTIPAGSRPPASPSGRLAQ